MVLQYSLLNSAGQPVIKVACAHPNFYITANSLRLAEVSTRHSRVQLDRYALSSPDLP